MAESSIFWATGSTGDGASAYTQAQCILWLHKTFCGASNEGVLKDIDNELEVTGAATPVAVNTGEAYVRGFPYFSTASVNVAIPTPSSNTRVDLIVLRASWAAQTVRITRIAGTEGAGAPSFTQTDGTTWDIPLAQASITTGGVITVTDTREFLHPNIAVNTDMLDDDAVTLPKMAANSVDSPQYVDGSLDTVHLADNAVDDTKAGNRVPQFYRRQGGSAINWNTAGTTTYTPTAVRIQGGTINWTGGAALTGSVTLIYPVAFSNVPIVFATCANDNALGLVNVSVTLAGGIGAPTATQVDISWRSVDGATNYGSLDFNWMAIGPE